MNWILIWLVYFKSDAEYFFCTRIFAKDGLLTGQEQASSRITLLVGCSFVCHHAENRQTHRKMLVQCPIVITSLGETLLQTRPGNRNNWSTHYFAQLTLHWVLVSFSLSECKNFFRTCRRWTKQGGRKESVPAMQWLDLLWLLKLLVSSDYLDEKNRSDDLLQPALTSFNGSWR